MREVMDMLLRAAKTPASILILGESGTGKSVAARAVHQKSHLADKPFVTVSCPSLSKELLESELFGHVKGAFTGAIKDHWGKVKAAEGGTLFLDEIGDLPMEIQPKLLRLLQEREYERLGENVTRQANVRIIAATNRDLKKRVAEGAFREDLYFRLNVIAVEMPPLRLRRETCSGFAEHYFKHFAAQCGRNLEGLSPEAVACHRALIPGRATCANCETPSNAPSSWPRAARFTWRIFPPNCAAPDASGPKLMAAMPRCRLARWCPCSNWRKRTFAKSWKEPPTWPKRLEILGIDQATLYRKRKKIGLE